MSLKGQKFVGFNREEAKLLPALDGTIETEFT